MRARAESQCGPQCYKIEYAADDLSYIADVIVVIL